MEGVGGGGSNLESAGGGCVKEDWGGGKGDGWEQRGWRVYKLLIEPSSPFSTYYWLGSSGGGGH